MKSLTASVTAMWIFAAAAAHADGCAQGIARAATQVLVGQRALQAIAIGDGFETAVSPPTRRAIARMKDAIDDYVAATMRCQPPDAGPQRVQRALAGLGGVKFPEEAAAPKTSAVSPIRYGDDLTFAVRAAAGIVSVVARFGIECGDDAMLMIFARRRRGWNEVLRSQSEPYSTVAGGWWSFDYAISPPDAAGKWFVVTKNIAPWCSSTWSEIRYAVLRPGARPSEPRRILARTDSIWWGSEHFGDLKVGMQDFDLRFRAESIDDGVHNREFIRHYSVTGDSARRIAPFAGFPRDFADEWIVSPWSEAAPWTSPRARTSLQRAHDQMHALRFLDYVSERSCRDGQFQIELEPTDPKYGAAHYYLLISGRADYAVIDVARTGNPACNGPDRVDPPVPQ